MKEKERLERVQDFRDRIGRLTWYDMATGFFVQFILLVLFIFTYLMTKMPLTATFLICILYCFEVFFYFAGLEAAVKQKTANMNLANIYQNWNDRTKEQEEEADKLAELSKKYGKGCEFFAEKEYTLRIIVLVVCITALIMWGK